MRFLQFFGGSWQMDELFRGLRETTPLDLEEPFNALVMLVLGQFAHGAHVRNVRNQMSAMSAIESDTRKAPQSARVALSPKRMLKAPRAPRQETEKTLERVFSLGHWRLFCLIRPAKSSHQTRAVISRAFVEEPENL